MRPFGRRWSLPCYGMSDDVSDLVLEAADRVIGGDHLGTVLVVEDDEAVREMYGQILADMGADVVTARDGAEALATLDERDLRPSLIIVDLAMPFIRGESLLECLRARPGSTDTPVLVVTAVPEGTRVGRIRDGVPVLRKPFSLDAFVAYVRDLVKPNGPGTRTKRDRSRRSA